MKPRKQSLLEIQWDFGLYMFTDSASENSADREGDIHKH